MADLSPADLHLPSQKTSLSLARFRPLLVVVVGSAGEFPATDASARVGHLDVVEGLLVSRLLLALIF